MAINLLRHNPVKFIVHVQRVHQKGLVQQSKAMAPIIEKLKQTKPMSSIRFDEQSNVACRANNDDIIGRAEDSPADGGNLSKLKEVLNNAQEPSGGEASYYNYKGSNAEEFVALLLYKDFDKASEPA